MSDISPQSVPGQINASTRSAHHHLNKFIVSRLPLCLPPHADDGRVYAVGIRHFSHVISTFESLWDNLPSKSPVATQEMLQFLKELRPEGMSRTPRVRRDLEFFTGKSGAELDALLAQTPHSNIEAYCDHIREVVAQKPHVLVAYAWCYYMAVFAGGRWIRDQLMKPGEAFWRNAAAPNSSIDVPLQEAGLAFWNFDGTQDGDDIKMPFRAKFNTAHESIFTPEQTQDVLTEAQTIFKNIFSVVEGLDDTLGTDLAALEKANEKQPNRSVEKAKAAAAAKSSLTQVQKTAWFRRPEIAGVVFVLACLAFMKVLGFNPSGLF